MKAAIFGGSFDPVHREHVRLVAAAIKALSLDRVFVVPARVAPHKPGGAGASGEDRLEACKIAFRGLPEVTVSDFELKSEETSYTYLTCRAFRAAYPDAERYLLVGADMLENFFCWKFPEDILENVRLAVAGRAALPLEALRERFFARFHTQFTRIPFTGEEISSTALRVALAFGRETPELDPKVREFLLSRGLYTRPAISPALALETEERRAHSFRVAKLACLRARSLFIPEEKALLAAALHDCGKYVPADSPLLEGFCPPEGVPAPVLHEYTGAYLAEHVFGIDDGEILDAIACHTSGRPGMTTLGKLLFLSDLLEEGRSFADIIAAM